MYAAIEAYYTWFIVISILLPQSQFILVLDERHDGPVHRLLVRGEPDVKLNESLAPLLDEELQAVPAAAGDAAAGHVQVLDVPAGQPDQRRVRDALAAPDVQQSQLGGLLQDPLDLTIVHTVEVAALVDPDGELLEEREPGRGDLLPHRRLVEAEHGVGGAEGGELGATLLQLLDVDEYGVAGRRRDVRHIKEFQILRVRLKKKILSSCKKLCFPFIMFKELYILLTTLKSS